MTIRMQRKHLMGFEWLTAIALILSFTCISISLPRVFMYILAGFTLGDLAQWAAIRLHRYCRG